MPKLAVVIKTKTLPGQRDAVYRLYEQHLAPHAAENYGQETAAVCLDENDADTFYLFEIYSSREAFEQAGPLVLELHASGRPIAGRPAGSRAGAAGVGQGAECVTAIHAQES